MLIAPILRAVGDLFDGRTIISLAAIFQESLDDTDFARDVEWNLVSAYAKTSLQRLMSELLRTMWETLW